MNTWGPHGGPTFLRPNRTKKPVLMFPLASVLTICFNEGGLQPTKSEVPMMEPSRAVGSFGVMLHSRRYPFELAGSPLAVTATCWPFTRPVEGVTVNWLAPKAE